MINSYRAVYGADSAILGRVPGRTYSAGLRSASAPLRMAQSPFLARAPENIGPDWGSTLTFGKDFLEMHNMMLYAPTGMAGSTTKVVFSHGSRERDIRCRHSGMAARHRPTNWLTTRRNRPAQSRAPMARLFHSSVRQPTRQPRSPDSRCPPDFRYPHVLRRRELRVPPNMSNSRLYRHWDNSSI